jgi:hypothetical protein
VGNSSYRVRTERNKEVLIENNPEHNQISLLLFDGHGEYTGGLQFHQAHNDDGVLIPHAYNVTTIWDAFEMQEVQEALGKARDMGEFTGEGELAETFDRLFPGLLTTYAGGYSDAEWGTWLKINGTREELGKVFAELLDALREPPSGDDSVYDYWPSGADLAWVMALDLDAAGVGNADHLEAITEVVTEVAKATWGPDWEYCEWDGDDGVGAIVKAAKEAALS